MVLRGDAGTRLQRDPHHELHLHQLQRELSEKRYEGKLTFSPTTKHTVKAAYSHISSTENGNTFGTIMDLGSLVNRATPQDLLSLIYTGILNPNLFVEAQYALRKYTFQGSGSKFTDPIQGTLLLDQSRGNARYWSPTLPCGRAECAGSRNSMDRWSSSKVRKAPGKNAE